MAAGGPAPKVPVPDTYVLTMWEAIGFALLGSAVVILLRLVQYARLPPAERPDLTDRWYWIMLIVLNPLCAGIAAYICCYGKPPMQPLTVFGAIALGAAAPAFLQRVIDTFVPAPGTPPKPPGA